MIGAKLVTSQPCPTQGLALIMIHTAVSLLPRETLNDTIYVHVYTHAGLGGVGQTGRQTNKPSIVTLVAHVCQGFIIQNSHGKRDQLRAVRENTE